MKKRSIIKRHIVVLFTICLFIAILNYFRITCPILYFCKIPCPTCGVTRAIFYCLKLDFQGSIYYHPLAIPLIVSTLLMLHLNLFKRKRYIYFFAFITFFLNTVLYIFRLLMFFQII
ncbi:MAG: DUF2752 domain-containing protein [Clostridia bacterium]|nr:DUF2752 domain-containing protein [Clostridia bacterium]